VVRRFLDKGLCVVAVFGWPLAHAQEAAESAAAPVLLADGCAGDCAAKKLVASGPDARGLASAGQAGGIAAPDEAAWRDAITQARAGDYGRAVPTLKSLSERYPERAELRNDYIVVLGWAGDDAAAVAQADKVDQDTAPAYVLEGLAGSARRAKRPALAQALYGRAAQRFPQRVEPRIGLIHAALDAGRTEEAGRQANQLAQAYPRDRAVLQVQGDAASARGDHFGALKAYQAVLDQSPEDRDALQGKARTLVRLGTPQLAADLARAHPAAFTPAQAADFAADSTAYQIRWGVAAADQNHGPERFAELDKAIAQSDAVAARALDRNAPLTPVERRLVLDRITALQARARMQETVDLYEAMAARPEPLPAYVKSAVASAYLYLRKPERARDLYREAVAAEPDNTGAQLGLFYALAESEDHRGAREQIEKLAANTPETINAYSAPTTQPNPYYLPVQIARAQAPLLANRPGEAWAQLRDLHARAPASVSVDTAYASSMRARGWPRLAEQELRGGSLTIDPRDSGALGERAGALLEMRDYRGAEAELAAGRAVAPEDQRVLRSGRLWQVHNMNELIVESAYGRSSGGGPAGSRDFELDARLYSKPYSYNWRAFGHGYTSQARFDAGTGRYDRLGAGLEYRSPRWVASGELAHDINRDKPAATLQAAYSPDDFWSFSAIGENDSLETPLQARQAGVTAWRGGLGATWRAHESRRIGITYDHLRFSDGNGRDIMAARWTERVVAGPIYKLEVTGTVAASRNSNGNAAYFNPSRDQQVDLEFANEWLQWRRYERAFRHRFIATVGHYWQESFGGSPVYGARYEQEWSADDRLVLRYGVGRTLHSYDAARTGRNYVYVALNWRF
jgi:biofilm PGA synthesis protein PgaA